MLWYARQLLLRQIWSIALFAYLSEDLHVLIGTPHHLVHPLVGVLPRLFMQVSLHVARVPLYLNPVLLRLPHRLALVAHLRSGRRARRHYLQR